MNEDARLSNRPWLKAYPAQVPAQLTAPPSSLIDLFDEACARFAAQTAFECAGQSLSFATLERLSRDFAAYLQGAAGLAAGDRVALMMPNLPQYPVALFGALRAGLVVVNVNPLYTPRELAHQLTDSGTKAILIADAFCPTLQAVLDQTGVRCVLTTALDDLAADIDDARTVATPLAQAINLRTALQQGRRLPFTAAAVTADDLAFLQYTGGTTGLAKGAALSHGNVAANVLQFETWLGTTLDIGRETFITALPLYHIFALVVNALFGLRIGARNILITNPRDMPAFVATLRSSGWSFITGVNTLFNGLLNTPGFAELDYSTLKLCCGGGTAIQQAVAERWSKQTGHPITEGYGLTECSPVVSFSIPGQAWRGTIGLPLPSTDVALRDDAERDVASGEPGELCVRGPQVMRGYWQKPEETAKVFTADGYLKTGDIAVQDADGFLRIVDRKKDMVIVSGFNVYPNEIESVVTLHPGVLECACVGVPDDSTGEAVKIFVVRKDPALSEADLRKHCEPLLTGYKRPRHIAFINELPKTNVGKVLRKELRGK